MIIFLIWPVGFLAGQTDANTSKTIAYQGNTWAFDEAVRAAEVEFCGRHALHVSAPFSAAMSVAKADFRNGVIEGLCTTSEGTVRGYPLLQSTAISDSQRTRRRGGEC